MNIILLLCLIMVIYINYSTVEGYYNMREMSNVNKYERNLAPSVVRIVEYNYGDSLSILDYKIRNIDEYFYTNKIKELVGKLSKI